MCLHECVCNCAYIRMRTCMLVYMSASVTAYAREFVSHVCVCILQLKIALLNFKLETFELYK